MEKPLISYVITSYNVEDYIEKSIQCALSQTYTPLEIVISDDCSTDRTFEIIEKTVNKYDGPHTIKLNRNKKNLGIARHMSLAYLELASGEIIVAAHGDDLSIPERTQLSYDFLAAHPNVTAISLGLRSINSKGEYIGTDDAIVRRPTFYSFDEGGNIPAPSRAFYKKVMTIFGPLNSDCPTEDELITFRALMLGANVFLPKVGVYYRKHINSSSNPENFAKFPLELILKQQVCDMQKGKKLQLISETQYNKKIYQLNCAIEKRKLYRVYFSAPTLSNLMKLLKSGNYSMRGKINLIRRHFLIKGKKIV